MSDIIVLASKLLCLIGLLVGFLTKDIYFMLLCGILLLELGRWEE